MEALILLALVVIIFLLWGLRSLQKEAAEKTRKYFQIIQKEIKELKESEQPPVKKEAPVKPTDEAVIQWRPNLPSAQPDIPKETAPVLPVTPIATTEGNTKATEARPAAEEISPAAQTHPPSAAEGFWEKWLRNNSDLERFVGENLVNKIGIAVLVLGIAFFVKYAIDQDWIKETGRVCIGIGCGIILTSIAHYLRNSYRSFSSVMAGGGIAVFYFTIAFAFHEYKMFAQTTAFIIMIVITVFAVTLSLLYNKIELAVIALLGGFLAPFLVSNGSGNYVALFSYLLVLNIGMLVIAYFKKWPLLHVLSVLFTLIIFGSWLIDIVLLKNTLLPYKNAMSFAAAFYIVFLTALLIHNLRTQKPFKAFDFSLLLLITFSFYGAGMTILREWNTGVYQGLFTIALAIVNLCLAWYLFKTQKGDRNLLYLLIGLTLTFISLAAPVQLHGHSITLFWSAECVLLYWLHQKSGITIFKVSSVIVLLLMLISLMLDWNIAGERSNTFLPVIFTNWQGAITNIVAILSLSLYANLLRKPTESFIYLAGIKNTQAAIGMGILAAAILYFTSIFAINLAFTDQQSFAIPNAFYQLITYAFVAVLLFTITRFRLSAKPIVPGVLILAAFLFYLSSSVLSNSLITGIVNQKYAAVHAVTHWISSAVLLFLLYKLIELFRLNFITVNNSFAWLICILFLIFLSIECRYLYLSILASPASIEKYGAQYAKAGLTIVLAVFSFIIMWLGMKYKYKTLRVISLSIFMLALLKLFLLDISNISDGGKIAAFIMLGILLLVISFMYQRLKKIIIDNEEKSS